MVRIRMNEAVVVALAREVCGAPDMVVRIVAAVGTRSPSCLRRGLGA